MSDAIIHRDSPVTVLSGVGKARAAAYERLGIRTLGDPLLHYPRAYENRGDVCLLCDARKDGKSSVILTVATSARTVRLRSHKSFLKFRAFDDSGSCEIVYFNQDYLKDQFVVGATFRFYGKVERKGKQYTLSSPVAEPYTESAKLPPFWAVYPLTEGLSQKQIAKDVEAALFLLRQTGEDPLPAYLRERRSLCTLSFAEEHIHRPDSKESLAIARRRLVYEEFFLFSLGGYLSRKASTRAGAPKCEAADPTPLLSMLPYELTGAQKRAIADIAHDMKREIPMSRILVGDVGCGKTVCAATAMLFAVQNGRQAALMAPTEILARQHYADLAPLFERLGVRCELLVGATTAAEKRRIKAALASTDERERLPIVIGTHALLSDGVEFSAPGLVVTDEQHRFGARQRAKLSEKNTHAHLLVMSATPIPRSLALVLYGDLDISRIDEMPAGRQRVDTFVVDESYRSRLLGFIRRQVLEGGQVYIVCPSIEEDADAGEASISELLSAEGSSEQKPPMKAAVQYAKELQGELPELTVAFLHGKMKSAEKDSIMKDFGDGKTQILVSTTVIEVGVNVPNASLMIVENAERFGLSQLHQLRGRVGRGSRKSYCILVTPDLASLSEHSRTRLNTMHTTYDGYRIAEQDLAQRGPGDFLASSQTSAVRQSGGLCFRLANAGEDLTLLTDASTDAKELAESSPTLADTPLLDARIKSMFSLSEGLIS